MISQAKSHLDTMINTDMTTARPGHGGGHGLAYDRDRTTDERNAALSHPVPCA